MDVGSLLVSIAGAQPKNEARDIPLYGDISVLSAVSTTLGYFMKCYYADP
jgi:hypothetical protein